MDIKAMAPAQSMQDNDVSESDEFVLRVHEDNHFHLYLLSIGQEGEEMNAVPLLMPAQSVGIWAAASQADRETVIKDVVAEYGLDQDTKKGDTIKLMHISPEQRLHVCLSVAEVDDYDARSFAMLLFRPSFAEGEALVDRIVLCTVPVPRPEESSVDAFNDMFWSLSASIEAAMMNSYAPSPQAEMAAVQMGLELGDVTARVSMLYGLEKQKNRPSQWREAVLTLLHRDFADCIGFYPQPIYVEGRPRLH
jgi:hypothetical protein